MSRTLDQQFEALLNKQSSLEGDLHNLESGSKMVMEAEGKRVTVYYDAEQAYGDDRQPVPGHSVGEFEVWFGEPGEGSPKRFRHGPDPNAKMWVARDVAEAVTSHFLRGRLSSKTAVKTQDGFEVDPDSGDDLYFALLHMAGDTWQAVGPFATLDAAAGRVDEDLDEHVVKAQFIAPGRTASRKQAGPYGSADDSPMAFWWRANQEGVVDPDDPEFDVIRETNDMSLAMEWDDPRFPRLEQTAERLMSALLLSSNEQAQAVGEDLRDKLRSLKTGSRKQAQGDNPYGGGDRANPYFDPAPSQQTGPSYVPAPEEVTRPVTTRPRGGDAGPDIEDQDTFTEDGQGFDMTQDRAPEQGSADQGGTMSSLGFDKVAVRCADCGQHGKLALSKVNDDLACRCGSDNVDLDDFVADPDHLALNAIARDIRKANPDLPRERVRAMAKRAHGLAKGS